MNTFRGAWGILRGVEGADLVTVTCHGGITEKDVDNFFQHVQIPRDGACSVDHVLHVRAIQLLRAAHHSIFKNAQLTIVGHVTAVRFVAGQGRRRFHVEHTAEKVKFQVHLENLVFGLFRLMIAMAALSEMTSAGLSLTTMISPDEGEEPADTSTLILVFINHLTTFLVGCLVAMETVSFIPSLFSPGYGHGSIAVGGHGGVGLWLTGPRRWLARAAAYAVLASRDVVRLKASQTSSLVPVEVLASLEKLSRTVLVLASMTSCILNVLHLRIPDLLKSPWCSPLTGTLQQTSTVADTTDMEKKDGDGRESAAVDERRLKPVMKMIQQFGSTESVLGGLGNESFGSTVDILEAGQDEETRHKGWCWRVPKLNHCSKHTILPMLTLVLCFLMALAVGACHVARLHYHDEADQTAFLTTLSSMGPVLVSVIVITTIGLECWRGLQIQLISSSPAMGPVPINLLHAASVTTLWSMQNVDWLMKVWEWDEHTVSVLLIVCSAVAVCVPAILMVIQRLLNRTGFHVDCGLSRSSVLDILHNKVPPVLFSVSVLLSLSGLLLAVLSLPMPVARVKTEYTDSLQTTFHFIRDEFQHQVQNHVKKLDELLNVNICGGKDVDDLKGRIDESRLAAAALSVEDIREYCDDMGWVRALEKDDKFCKNYLAAKLYFDSSSPYNNSIHDRNIQNVKKDDKKEQETYYKDLIDADRLKQLQNIPSDKSFPDSSVVVHEDCLVTICVAKYAALVIAAIPFVGIGGTVAVVLLFTIEAALKLLIKIAQLQETFLLFHANVRIIFSKLSVLQEEPTTLQFSLANFNLIYLAYPALLTGCVGVLVGFWHRRGAALGRRCRSTLVVVMPLMVMNIFGLAMTVAWTNILVVIGEVAPLIHLTVTPLGAIEGLELAYTLCLTACLLFVLLALWEKRQYKTISPMTVAPEAETLAGVTLGNAERPSEGRDRAKTEEEQRLKNTPTSIFTVERTAGEHNGETATIAAASAERDSSDASAYRGGSNRPMVWILAVMLSLVACGLVSDILWNPIFAFTFELNQNMTDSINQLGSGAAETAIAKKLVSDSELKECGLVDFVGKSVIQGYKDILNNVDAAVFRKNLEDVKKHAKTTVQPALMLLQVPVLLTVYVPTVLLLWSLVCSWLKPQYSLHPSSLARLTKTLSWLSLGWLANGVLFLMTLTQSGAIPVLNVYVSTGSGFAFAVTANVLMILVSHELRIGTISPLL